MGIRGLMTRLACALLAVGMTTAARGENPPAAEPPTPEAAADAAFRVYWKDGLRLDSADKAYRMQLGGRIMADFAWIAEDAGVRAAVGDQEDGVEFRRARIHVEGEIHGRFYFKGEYDFAGGDVAIKDAYLGIRGLPVVGRLQVGHFKEPYGLDETTSTKYITFMEKALPVALTPGSENMGVALFNTLPGDRAFWGVGVFKDTDDTGSRQSEGEWAVTGRVTGLPWCEEDGARYLHLGLGASVRSPVDGTVRYRQRPEMHLADYFVDTGAFDADRELWIAPEAAVVCGPVSVQGEFLLARVVSDGAGDPTFTGFYVFASCFLTGEHRPYRPEKGSFGRVRPIGDFLGPQDGPGAIEVAVRFSALDLNDGPVAGGALRNVTAGLTWYLNPNLRLMFNGVFADLKDVGDARGFMTRVQFDF